MKHTFHAFLAVLCVLALLLGCVPAMAAQADFRYEVGADGAVTLTAYTGSAASPEIPAKIDGKPVTAIGDGCFQGMICLKKVHIPEGVTRIGDYAFECCSALQKVYLPASLTEIGEGAFSGCGSLTLADMQDGVERIGRGAFLCCDALVHLELSAALKELGDFAFAGCAGLARVQFGGDALTAIPDRAFYGCEALTRINLPEPVQSVGKRAFSGCANLQSFYHGRTLERLGAYAFENCEKLANADVTPVALEEGTFRSCGELSYLVLSDGAERIEPFAFRDCGAQDLTVSATVTEIAPGAFYGSNVRCVTVDKENPAWQTADGALYAKDGKTLLAWFPADPYAEEPQTEFTVPDGVETIAPYAFAACPLERIALPASLKEIGAYAFAQTEVQDMTIPEGVKVDPNAFTDPDAPEEDAAAESASALGKAKADAPGVTTQSAAGDKSLYREADFKDFRAIENADFDAWCEDYLTYNEAHGNPIREELIPYIMRYKGEVVPHFMAMTAVQNHDPEMWANAANFFGDDFEQMYLMMNHGLFTELRRGKMSDDLVLYSGVYDSQLMAAAGTKTVPTQQQLIDAIGAAFTDPVMISTTTDPGVACGFGDTLFIIYASREAMEGLGAVCMDAVVHSSENEILMTANARYRVLDVGSMTVTHQDPWEEKAVTEERSYVRVELLPPEPPKNPFVDVAEGSFYYDAVLWAAGSGVTDGTDATHFTPSGSATRAQAVTFLWRAVGSPAPKGGKAAFADVKAGSYYADAVQWAVEQGVTNGTSKTTFSPDKVCTRAEIVTFLYRAAKSPAVPAKDNPFADVKADSYYYEPVLWATAQKITNGTSETTFSPDKTCTRGETVTFLFRAQ